MKGAVRTLATFRPVLQLELNRGHYQPRGIEIVAAFKGAVPDHYRFATLSNTGNLVLLADLSNHTGSDDIYAIPDERVGEMNLRHECILGAG